MVHACNLAFGKVKEEDFKFEVYRNYKGKHCLKNSKTKPKDSKAKCLSISDKISEVDTKSR